MLFDKKNISGDNKEFPKGKKNLFSTSLLENYKPCLEQKSHAIINSQRKSLETSPSIPTIMNNKILQRRQFFSKKSEDLQINPRGSKEYLTPSEFFSTFDNSKESKASNNNEISDENQDIGVEFPKKSFLRKMLNGGEEPKRSITGEIRKRTNRTEVSLNSLMHAYMSNSTRAKF